VRSWALLYPSLPCSRDLSCGTPVGCFAGGVFCPLVVPFVGPDWEVGVFVVPGVSAFAVPGGKLGVYPGLFTVASPQKGLAPVIGPVIAH
jgi:Putative Zn-dependent protease, contains TPR repeats